MGPVIREPSCRCVECAVSRIRRALSIPLVAIDPLVPKYRECYAKRAETASGRTKSERIPAIVLLPYYGGVKRTRAECDPDYDDGGERS